MHNAFANVYCVVFQYSCYKHYCKFLTNYLQSGIVILTRLFLGLFS